MILFRERYVKDILIGRKTQTRRVWKKRRCVPGAIHQARATLFGEPFAHLLIKRVWQEPIGEISDADVFAEGFESTEEFFELVESMSTEPFDPDQVVWCVEFEVVNDG